MKLTRRFLALLLALSLSLSMVTPAFASEAETVPETEPVVVVEETEAAAVETTEAETEAPATEAPVVEETEAPVVEETAPVVEETEAPAVEETEAIEVADADAAYASEEAVAGSTEDNPVLLYPNMFSFEGVSGTCAVTVPAGTTYYYALYNAGGMVLTIDDGEASTLTGNMMFPDTFSITNAGEAEQEYILALSYPVGNVMNPKVLAGSAYETAVLELGNFDGYYYSFTAESDGTAKMYLDYGIEDADIVVTDQNSKQYTLSEDGVDNYGLELVIDVAAGDVLTINVGDTTGTTPAREIGWNFVFTYPQGSEQNPIYPEWAWNEDYTKATAKVTVAKKSSVWVTVNGGDMLLNVDGKAVEVVPTINAYGFEAFNVKLENTTTKNKTFTLVQTYAEGARENPKVLNGVLTGGTISLAEGDDNGYTYSYIVPETCTYTFYISSITEGVTADIIVNNETTYESKWLSQDGVDNYGLEMYMDVNAGDRLTINVVAQGSYDESWNYLIPAADISWTVLTTYPAGSQKNPINPDWTWNEAWTEATATVTVPAGATQWFNAGMGEIVITVDGAEVALETITNAYGMSASIFSLTNETEAEVTYELGLGYVVGTRENPEILNDPSKFVANLAQGDKDGRYYTYFNKAAKGTLTFSGKSAKRGVGFDIVLSKAGSYETYALSESSNGTVSIDVAPWDQIIIQVVAEPNKSWVYPAAKITVTSTFEYPLGSQMNPDKLVIGENAGTVEAGSVDGYQFTWTATEDGELLIQMGENETGWSYTVNNLTTYSYGDTQWSDTGSDNYSVMVSKGDEIQVVVNTYDPESWNNPAGTVKFNASFTSFKEITSGKSTTLKFIDPRTGKAVSGSKVNWAIDGVYVFDPNGEEVEYTDTSAYATIKNGVLKTFKCGDRVNVIITATLKSDPSVSVKYHVVVLPASNIMSIWDTWYDFDENGEMTEYRMPVIGNCTWNVNGATEEDAQYMVWNLDAFSYPSNSSQKVTWKSSNKKIVTVDENGVLRPVWDAKKGAFNTGTVTITATATDGSGKKASFKMTVDKLPNWMNVERADGVAFEQGEYQGTETKYNPETGMWEEVEQYEKIMYIAPGETIKLKTTVDPTASKKYQTVNWSWWGDVMFTMKKLSGNQYSIKANNDAHDGAWCYVEAYVPYGGWEQIKVVVKAPVTRKLEICWLGEGNYEPITWSPSFDINEFNGDWAGPMMKAVLFGSDGTVEVVDADWTSSNTKLAKPVETSDEWDGSHVMFEVTPKKTGSFTVTASYTTEDGKKLTDKLTLNIADFNTWVTSLKITAPEQFMGTTMDYVEVWNNEFGYWEYVEAEVPAIYVSAGQSITLKAVTNASAKNKSMYWYCWSEDGPIDAKISSSGKLTVGKNFTEVTKFYVECYPKGNNTVGAVKIPVFVAPRATNVHARIILNDKLLYTSNTTRNWSIAADGEKLEVSALVYPFDASQNVTWASSNKKVAYIDTEIDEDGTVHTYIVFTGTKTGKVTFTATANDGSKEKASFTLVVGN